MTNIKTRFFNSLSNIPKTEIDDCPARELRVYIWFLQDDISNLEADVSQYSLDDV